MIDASLAPRSDFPALGELTYLNTASIGLVPLPVQDEAQRTERAIALRGTTWFDEKVETGVLERARAGAARLLGADREQIAVTSSATEALGQIAWMLRPVRGANVVTAGIEFPSVTYPWLRVARETGAEVRIAPTASLDALAALVDDRTDVIALSHVQYSTGMRLSLEALSELAVAHDARLVIDATQSAGHVPIDLSAPGVRVDALVTGGYKWLCGPFGAAICWLHPHLLERFEPVFVGWRSTPEPYELDARRLTLAGDARRLEYSTMSYSAAVALGVDRILEHDRRLARRLQAGLESLGAECLTPDDDDARGGTVAVRFPGRDGADVAAWLNASDVVVSPRAGFARLSVHFFNDADDVDRALAAVGAVLRAGGPLPGAGRPGAHGEVVDERA